MVESETATQLTARLRAVTEEDAADVLASAAVSEPLTAEDVAFRASSRTLSRSVLIRAAARM